MASSIGRTGQRRSSFPARALLSTAVLAWVSGCGSTPDLPSSPALASTPEHSAEGKESRHFVSLSAMATASDWILRAKVRSVRPGKTYGESKEDQVVTRFVDLQPVEVIKSSSGAKELRDVTYEEEGWNSDGSGFVMNGVLWSQPGDEGWYFLRQTTDGSIRLVSSFGRFTIQGERFGPSGIKPDQEGPWARESSDVFLNARSGSESVRSAAEEEK